MHKKADRSAHKHGSLSLKLLTALLVITIAWILFFSYHSIEIQFCEERLNTLDVVSEKLTENTLIRFESQWDILTVSANDILTSANKSNKTLTNCIAGANDAIEYSDARLFLFDDEGMYYDKTGQSGRWEDQDSLQNESTMPFVTINSLVTGSQTESFMTFFRCFDRPITLDGKTFTHIALARKISSFDKDLSIGSYGKVGSAFVIHTNGVRIYHQSDNDIFAQVYNVLYALKDSQFQHDISLEKIRESMASGKSGTAHFVYRNTDYAMAYQYMGVNDWYSVYLIPMDSMSKGTGVFIRQTVISIGAAAAVLLGIFLLITYLTNRRWRIRQSEINENLRIAVDDANKAKEEANRANRAKSDFLSRMSHDIRTPLNGIIGMTSIAQASIDKKQKLTDCLAKISFSSDHLLSLVNDVLDMAQIESGKTEIHHEHFNLKKLLEECVHIIESRLADRSITFICDFQQIHHKAVIGDDSHLKQVLVNILGNSVKFTPDGGQIYFTVSEGEKTPTGIIYRFEIKDTGQGMSEEFLQHLFEPFVQEGNSARSKYKGTGLGLAIVKELVDLMGGQIQVESLPDQGSCFTVYLHLMTDPESEVSDEEKETILPCLSHKKILLVEDNELNLEIALYMLEDSGLTVITAENGLEAINQFSASEPNEIDAILMDVMMPVMDGLTATQQIRALDRPDAATVPIIAMTANAYKEDNEKSINAGMNLHLAKPLNKDKLLHTLMEILK